MYEDYKADVSATVEWQSKNHVQNNEQTINNCSGFYYAKNGFCYLSTWEQNNLLLHNEIHIEKKEQKQNDNRNFLLKKKNCNSQKCCLDQKIPLHQETGTEFPGKR